MSEIELNDGKIVYYDYDPVQDILYVLFTPTVGPTCYEDSTQLPGVMLRYNGRTEELVGLTVHNVQRKLMRDMVCDLLDQTLPRAA
jgi:hypothetical protein